MRGARVGVAGLRVNKNDILPLELRCGGQYLVTPHTAGDADKPHHRSELFVTQNRFKVLGNQEIFTAEFSD